jgi:acyl carrier protein phosphodiesterase
LSNGNEDVLLGNFMADFISNRQVANLSPGIQSGVTLHRMIDSFTDNHLVVRKGTKRLRPAHGKYAPVVIDIIYDFILANNWNRYSSKSLEVFSIECYEILNRRLSDLPYKLARRVPLMIADDFLLKYRSFSGLERALSSMDRRTKFPSNFIAASKQVKDEFELFDEEFNRFFPEVINLCENFLSNIDLEAGA